MSDLHPIEMFFSSHHPLAAKVDADFSGSRGGTVQVALRATEDLVADTASLTVHSAFATIVLDSIMGGAVMGTLQKLVPIATVGLSVSHLRKAKAGELVRGKATCLTHYRSLAYVTGELTDADGERLAIATGTFMIGTRGTSIREKAGDRIEDSRI